MSISSTECIQFMKLPTLANHYIEHKSTSHQLSFIDFLIMHYATYDQNDNDEDKDNQLPFKGTLQSLHGNLLYCSSLLETTLRIVPHQTNYILVWFDEHASHSAYLPSIWQPPKKERVYIKLHDNHA